MADISELTAEVDALEGVVPSAIALIDGIIARVEAAVSKAVSDNDAADLSAITSEVSQIRAQRDALAAAVAAHAPEAPPEG